MLESFFNKVEGHQPAILLKMRFLHGCFPVNFAKLLRATFFIEQLCVTSSERNYNQKIYALALTNGYKKFDL